MPHACPSGRCREGAALLAVRDGESLGYITPALPVTADFVRRVAGTAPERRFRFTERCVEAGCGQWAGNQCGLIQRLLASSPSPSDPRQAPWLPACAIRETCRWFAQEGPRACGVCPEVVRDNRSQLYPIEFAIET